MSLSAGQVWVFNDGSRDDELIVVLARASNASGADWWACLVLTDDVVAGDVGTIRNYNVKQHQLAARDPWRRLL